MSFFIDQLEQPICLIDKACDNFWLTSYGLKHLVPFFESENLNIRSVKKLSEFIALVKKLPETQQFLIGKYLLNDNVSNIHINDRLDMAVKTFNDDEIEGLLREASKHPDNIKE